MAIETHGLTANRILQDLPFVEGLVTQNSSGVSTTDIDTWTTHFAGRINAVVEGRDALPAPANLGENFRELVRGYIIAGVKRKALEEAEFPRERIQGARSEEREILKTIRTSDVDTGKDFDASDVVDSNVDTSAEKPELHFSGQRGDFW